MTNKKKDSLGESCNYKDLIKNPDDIGFSNDGDRKKFLTDFKKFHHKDNADKQDIEQFVNQEKLERIIDYLKNFGDHSIHYKLLQDLD